MGTTTSGLPYPEETDRVRDGAAAIKALAEAADLAVPVKGMVMVQVSNSNVGTQVVTLPTGAFPAGTSKINVQATTYFGVYSATLSAEPTASGFTVVARRYNDVMETRSVAVGWTAQTL